VLIGFCETGGQLKRALQLLDEMTEHNVMPDVTTFNTAMAACGKGGNWRKVRSIIAAFMREGDNI